jgi:aspartyl protease
MVVVNYSQSHLFGSQYQSSGASAAARPWVEVDVIANGANQRVWCLLDSGADLSTFDVGTAAWLGLNLASMPTITPRVVGGTTTLWHCPSVDLDFAGVQLTGVDVLFGSVIVPLLSRRDFLHKLDIGLNFKEWLHT